MKLRKYTPLPIIKLACSFFLLLLVTTGCTLDGITDQQSDTRELTEEDLIVASQIVGESLSDENDGVMASLNDALNSFSPSGFTADETNGQPGNVLLIPTTHDDDSKSGRGSERNFSYSFDPSTGIHTLAFKRLVHDGDFFKEVVDTLQYIFTDTDGSFIARPRENKELIETIDFKAFRDGTIQSPERESFFTRQDTFLLDGVSESSGILSIDGVHHGDGTLKKTTDTGNELQRTYNLVVNFLDIKIEKALVRESKSLEQGVTGVLDWRMEIVDTENGTSETKIVTGTVEMNGDGTALLRFEGFERLFQINLDNGDVRDHDDEFEGQIKQVNLERSQFTLFNGRIVQVTDSTEFDPDDDIHSLEAAARHLEKDLEVYAKGEGSTEGELFVASEIELEGEEVDHDDIEVVEGRVASVAVADHRFTVGDLVIRVTEDTEFDDSGDLFNLTVVADELNSGNVVEVKVEGIPDSETAADLVALQVRFEMEDPEVEAVEGEITSVQPDANLFTVNGRTLVRIDDQTEFDGDILTLAGVAEALAKGLVVETRVEGIIDTESDANLLARDVRFETEEPEETNIEGEVTSVQTDANTFTVNDTTQVRVNDFTEFDTSGDLFSLAEVAEARNRGDSVVVRVEAVEDSQTDADLLARSVRFEITDDTP